MHALTTKIYEVPSPAIVKQERFLVRSFNRITPNMNREFFGLDLDTLQALYQEETNRLQDALLAGASWDSLQEQKIKVTELAITIHRKKYPLYFNPAEFSSRKEQHNPG